MSLQPLGIAVPASGQAATPARARLQRIARASLVVTAASLAFSSAATSGFMLLAFACWAASGQWSATWRRVLREPAAWMALALFGMLAVGVAWSPAPLAESSGTVAKYRELAFFGIVMALFADERWRERLLAALFASGAVLVLASYAVHFGIVPPPDAHRFNTDGAVLLKNSITHSFLVSLLAFAAALLALHWRGRRRWIMAAVALLAAANVVVAVQGRTGYVVLSVLAVWLAASRWSIRGVAAALAAIGLAGTMAYLWAPTFQARIDRTLAESRIDPSDSSMTQRLVFWEHSVALLKSHPLAGVGTGGWGEAFYRSTAQDEDPFFHDRVHKHPHNEYLNLAVQVGIGGLALFVAMLAAAFVRAGALAPAEATFARGVVLAFAVGCLFNDFMRDTTEGHLWALLVGALFGATLRDRHGSKQGETADPARVIPSLNPRDGPAARAPRR